MRVETARTVARATNLPWGLQRKLWQTGDSATQARVAGQANLDPEIEAEILQSSDSRVITGWLAVARDPVLVEEVAGRLTDDHGLLALARQPALTERALLHAASAGGDVVVSSLLDRSNVPDSVRSVLVARCVARPFASTGRSEAALLAALEASPQSWADSMIEGLRDPDAVVPWPSRPSRPEVLEALVRVYEASRDAGLSATQERKAASGVKEVLASPALTSAQALRVAAAAHDPEVASLARARAALDVPAMASQLRCPPCGKGVLDDREHLEVVKSLIEVSGTVRVPGLLLAQEAVAHRDGLGELARVAVSAVRGDDTRALLASVERHGGPDCAELPFVLEHCGLWTADEMSNPRPAFAKLAGESHAPLLLPSNVPADVRPTVARNFAPVHRILSETVYADLVVETIEVLPAAHAEVVWAMLDEWEGSLETLISAAAQLSS